MLAPPPSTSASDALAEALAPKGTALKARGFQQTGGRVQKRGGGGGGAGGEADEDGLALWTETPQQRMDRMTGARTSSTVDDPKAAEKEQEAKRELYKAQLRDEEMRRQVEQARSHRPSTLLEQHQAKRRKEYADGKGGSDERKSDRRRERDEEGRRRARDDDDRRGEREEDDRRRDRHRHRSRRDGDADDDRRRRSRRDRDEEDEERRHRSRRDRDDEDDRRREKDKHRRRDHDHDRDRDRERKPRTRTRTRTPSPPRRKSGREKEAEVEAGLAAPSIWDREKAMSFIPLMDQSKRAKTMNDAQSGLGDRFGQSSAGSRFL